MSALETKPTPANEESGYVSDHKHAKPAVSTSSKRKRLQLHVVNAIIMLLALYTVQKTIQNYFENSLSLVLAAEGAEYSQLGILKLIGIAWGLKALFAPILDIIACLVFLISFYIDGWIAEYTTSLWLIVLSGTAVQLFNGIEDVAIDGWVLTLLPFDEYSKGASSQVAGGQLGQLFGYYFFIPLSSADFCNKYIFNTPRTTGLLDSQSFMMIFAVVAIVLAMWIMFCKKERNPSKNEYTELKHMNALFKSLYQNKNLRLLSILFLTYPFCLMAIQESYKVSLVRNGMSTSDISNIGLICLPINLFVCWKLPEYVKKNSKLIRNMMITVLVRLVVSVGIFYTYMSFDVNTSYKRTWYLLLGFKIIEAIATSMQSIYETSFLQHIADVEIGGSFMAFLNVINKIGSWGWDIICLFLLQYVDQYIVAVGSWVGGAIYLVIFARYAASALDNEPKENFQPRLCPGDVPYSEIPDHEEPIQEDGDDQPRAKGTNI